MAVLEPEGQLTPRSARRYQPIAANAALTTVITPRRRRSSADARMTTAPVIPDDRERETEHVPVWRSIRSVERARRSAERARPRLRLHPLLAIGLCVIVLLLLWAGVTQLFNWSSNEWNTLQYGNPRTFQIEAVVGQGDSAQHPSHFIAVNLHGTVTIIEFPAGDSSKARVLASTSVLGPNADQAVVTLRFVDISHNGKPDMLVNVGGIQSILVNDGTTFRPPTASEQQSLFESLQTDGQ